jgi:hypothetical protein
MAHHGKRRTHARSAWQTLDEAMASSKWDVVLWLEGRPVPARRPRTTRRQRRNRAA